MAKNLLFVTNGSSDFEEGFSYVAELSSILGSSVLILMVYDRNLLRSFEGTMSAIAFAEAGEFDSAKEISTQWISELDEETKKRTALLIEKYGDNTGRTEIRSRTGVGDVVRNIKKAIESERAVEMVLLSPSLSGKGLVYARKLIKEISKPVVTISNLSDTGA